MKEKKSIGIIGFGNMGAALTGRLRERYSLFVFDKDRKKTKTVKAVNRAKNLKDLLANSEIVILAVKPQDFPALFREIKAYLKDKLVISIAAGISTRFIEKSLAKARVVRVMPNMPAKIGKGISCLAKGRFAKKADLVLAEKIFKGLGLTLILEE